MAKRKLDYASISHADILAKLHYDPETGHLTWKKAGNRTDLIGSRAGALNGQGYRRIQIKGMNVAEHRLIWFYMTGVWPEEVDHINGEPSDNRWSNLREADRFINTQNTIRKPSESGYIGVSRYNASGLWKAQIVANRKKIFLGAFECPKEAHEAYLKAKADLHAGFVPERFKG